MRIRLTKLECHDQNEISDEPQLVIKTDGIKTEEHNLSGNPFGDLLDITLDFSNQVVIELWELDNGRKGGLFGADPDDHIETITIPINDVKNEYEFRGEGAIYTLSVETHRVPKGLYSFRTWTHQLISAKTIKLENIIFLSQVPLLTDTEVFLVIHQEEDKYAIQSTTTGKWVSSNNVPPFQLHQIEAIRGNGEKFTFEHVDENEFAIKCCLTGQYVSANNAPPWQIHQMPQVGTPKTWRTSGEVFLFGRQSP